jgi:geranylgeranyl diphosphate synthase, type I
LGEAFQLRDDLLGVFGDSSVTGKPVGDDLREGKLTSLIAAASTRVDADGARLLEQLGRSTLDDSDIEALQRVLETSGARAEIETAIEKLVDEALEALAVIALTDDARRALEELAVFVAWRDR